MSRPLDQIRKETKAANRSHHLRKANQTPIDPIDALDDLGVGGAYHHDGPFDAALASRNRDARYAPVEAVRETNLEALKATPAALVEDSLAKHVPLHGTAILPPGAEDVGGRRMDYEEGADLMRESDAPGGPYKRYDHMKYHPDDLKGKGEPSYSLDLAEKQKAQERKLHRKSRSAGSNGTDVYEMAPQQGRSRGASTSAQKGDGADVSVRRR